MALYIVTPYIVGSLYRKFQFLWFWSGQTHTEKDQLKMLMFVNIIWYVQTRTTD